jgi:signal transduction histidine kinase
MSDAEPLRILLLEDSAFDAELLRESLRHTHPGARFTWVQDEERYVAEIAREAHDLILSDFQLPGYSGAQALDHAQQACPQIPFIFVSGVIGEDNAVDLLKRGATDYVIKGRLSRLPVAIERALAEVAQREARLAAEARLRQAKEEAERANRAKDRFLAVLSHELRTPLTPIAAAAHVLERCATVPDRFAHLLPMIRRNVEIEARLIDDLLDLTALGAGKIRLQRAPVEVHRLVHDVLQMLDADIAKKALLIHLALVADRCTVDGDAARLQQVIWNLLRNAVKFTPEHGSITVTTGRDGDTLVFSCQDTGIGISPEALPRIFMPFEQADAEVAQRFGGLGLGLAIAHGLVEQHAGELSVHSDGRHHGSTFTLRLPLLPVDTPQASTDEGCADDLPSGESGVRLLLVEDNADAAEALGLSLQQLGYVVAHAHSRGEALAMIDDERYDVVLTDLGLPDGSGIEIGRRVGARVPVIALSGFGSPGDLRDSAAAGFIAHLVKPVDPAAVHDTVQAALGRR